MELTLRSTMIPWHETRMDRNDVTRRPLVEILVMDFRNSLYEAFLINLCALDSI